MHDKDLSHITFVQRLTVHASYLKLVYNGTNVGFCRPTNVIYTLFSRYLLFSLIKRHFMLFIIKIYIIHIYVPT